MTLVEVVAGLALMATLLVAMIVLKSKFSHTLAESRLRRQGVAAADLMLSQWWTDPAKFPINQTGPVPDSPALSWRTAVVPNPPAARLESKVVRVEIVADHRVVTSVEVMLPSEGRP